MSLSVAGVWAVGVWDQTVWADGVWREGAYTPPVAPVSTTPTGGGFGIPVIVRPIKRHKKLDTFRQELDKLINGVQEAAQVATEAQPVIEKAAAEIDAITERFNIVQTFDDNTLIASQMEMIRQDYERAETLIRSILANRKPKQIQNTEEEILLLLATEVF